MMGSYSLPWRVWGRGGEPSTTLYWSLCHDGKLQSSPPCVGEGGEPGTTLYWSLCHDGKLQSSPPCVGEGGEPGTTSVLESLP